MDRELTKEEKRKDARKRWFKAGGIILEAVIAVCVLLAIVGEKIYEQ
ncbi:MAG: hypothetical protein K2H76_06595 [Muribaculaceae bacterium]|nr:hypothetical protein [Muribaculaceae bacterium]